jgi:hypothetical protein
LFTRPAQDLFGFYIDMGALELIINGHVAARSGVSVHAIREWSVVLSDGTACRPTSPSKQDIKSWRRP